MGNELQEDKDMRSEYDFSSAKPSPTAQYFREAGVRVLDEDVREAFPDSESVNKALRGLIEKDKTAGDVKRHKAA